MDWTLERVNGPRDFILLKKSERSYPCGRLQTNKIVCPSLVVSRKHCIFVRTDNVISVIDLGSSNGIYVNGELIEPSVLLELKENDIIGIGSSDEYRDDEPMFVYKLHKGNLNSRNLEEFDDLLTQRPSTNENILQAQNPPDISVPIAKQRVETGKRKLSDEIKELETPVVPKKITKFGNGVDRISDASGDDVCVDEIKPNSNSQAKVSPEVEKDPDIAEIEEVWSTLSPRKISKQKINGGTERNGVAIEKVEKIGTDLNRSNRLTLNIENEEKRKEEGINKPPKNVDLVNGEMRLTSITTSIAACSSSMKGERESQASNNKQERKKSKEKDIDIEIYEGKSSSTDNKNQQKPAIFNNGVENPCKTIRSSLCSSSSSPRFTVDILQPNGADSGAKDDHKFRYPNSEIVILKRREEANGTEDKIKSRFSFETEQPSATSSPLKLKRVKQEPMTSFSIFDTVDLSDDDDDIFPSSQLFDSTNGCGGLIKIENNSLTGKSENVSENEEEVDGEEQENKSFFTQVETAIEESEEIITLSDSDDDEEDNPWLDRLSESQRIKEEKPEVEEEDEANERREENIVEMEFVDELLELKRDFPIEEELNNEIDIKVPLIEEKEKSESPKSVSKKMIRPSRSMTLSEIEKDVNEEDNSESDSTLFLSSTHSSPPHPSRLSPRDRMRESLEKSREESVQTKPGTTKGPEIIKPLHLSPRKRLSLKDTLSSSSIEGDNSALPSTSKSRVRVRDCSVEVPKLPSHLTAKEKRQLQIEDRIKQRKYEDEQKMRRIKNKWAQSIPLPLGKRKSPVISKKQKLKIVNERKEKLKALATKQKLEATKPSVERVAAKPKAKISTKNRGDFLISEQVVRNVNKAVTDVGEASTSRLEPESSKAKTKNSEKSSKSSSSSKKTPVIAEKVSKNVEKEESKSKKDKKRSEKRSKSVEKRICDNSLAATTSNAEKNQATIDESLKELSLNQKENRVPNSLDEKKKEAENIKGMVKDGKNKKKKKVTFCNNVDVRIFEIDPNNTMKKCIGKDALIPKDKYAIAKKKLDKAQQPKLEEFLMHIFKWNPSWLEEQKRLNTEPPVVNNEALIPLLTNYKTYKDYYDISMPLLLLELWHGITKEFESIDRNHRRRPVVCSIVKNSVTFEPIPSANTTLTTMLLEVLASEEDIKRQIHPVYGDLVFLELCYRNKNDEGKQNFLNVFAYVNQLHRTPITPNTIFNHDLMNYSTNPSRVLTYTVLTRPLKVELCINRVARLRCVTYLRANMRTVQALQALPRSPLLDLIIDPKVEQYKLSSPLKQQSCLVTRDKLNHKQTEAVFKITEAIVKKEPKICLVQGPPGTGKSEVIVNMVMQILYGDNRYKNRENTLRILLCAPSNAAIDEIVSRLLDRRAKLTNDRFKMVRVGLLGPMHPRVREISVEELAKRDVKRTINNYQSSDQTISSIDDEKRFLEARINALKSALNSSQHNHENQIHDTKMKLMAVQTRYDTLNTWTQTNGKNINPRDLLKLQRGAETKILIGADIITCTLSSCYTNIMESAFGGTQKNISVCIVDEATQSCEAETLIPLMLGVNTLVLVGDPAQLPATVISQRAKKLGLDQSLFSRAQRAFEGHKNSPVIMLDVQYRMDEQISRWPNRYFYGGKLRNGITREPPALPFHPYRVLNLDSVQNNDKFSNTQEAEFVANLIYSMINYMDLKKSNQSIISIGVITPYRNQQSLVQTKINQRILPILDNLKIKITTEVNTVDSFQGHERDIVIMSCVRTNGIGFLSDPQRLCVALTRAKHCLVLCGNFSTFQGNTMWRALITDAQIRKNYISMRSDSKPNEILSQLVR